VPEDKLQVIFNFVDLASFRPPSPRERVAARQKLGVAADDRVLILPGRISVQKHQLGLLAALRILARSGRLPEHARVLLAGRDLDRNYARVVRWLIGRWGLGKHVRLLGAVSDMVAAYHAADAVILPSLYEGMPNAAIEGQACGLPVLVSRAANADGLVLAQETGIEVPTADRAALAEGLARLFAASAAELAALGASARAHVSAMLDNERLLCSITALYDELLASRGLAPRAPGPDAQSTPEAVKLQTCPQTPESRASALAGQMGVTNGAEIAS
jgi:glycosyltransferase involved in cell wall biosynthesis